MRIACNSRNEVLEMPGVTHLLSCVASPLFWSLKPIKALKKYEVLLKSKASPKSKALGV